MFRLRPSFCSIATVIGVCVFVRVRAMFVPARRRRFFPCRRRRRRRAAVRRKGRRRAQGTPIRRHLAARCTDRCADRRHIPRIRRASKACRPGRGCCISSRHLCTTFCGRVFCSRLDVWRPRGPGPPRGYGHAHGQQHHDGGPVIHHQRPIRLPSWSQG